MKFVKRNNIFNHDSNINSTYNNVTAFEKFEKWDIAFGSNI